MSKGIWITWEKQRRNKGISHALNWRLYEIAYDNKSKAYRYFISIIKTVSIILKENAQIVVAQNPSKILTFVVILLKKIFSYKAVIDAHNKGIFPLEGKSKLLMYFSNYFQRNADLTIVTNNTLKSIVESHNGKAYILPDKIPSIPEIAPIPLHGRVNIVFICTFAEDEPYLEVIEAANKLPEDIFIYVTGNFSGKIDDESVPNNVMMLGFVPDFEYWSILYSADIIMDLTTREGCLVCGAYEGVALIKPLILSDTKTIKSYFNKGCIYVEPTVISIVQGIKKAIKMRDKLSSEIEILKWSLNNDWEKRLNQLQKIFKLL